MVSVFNHPMTYTLGLYEIDCTALKNRNGPSDGFDSFITLGNILGWIPIIGSIIGAVRFGIGYNRYKKASASVHSVNLTEEKEAMKGLMYRGIAEVLCLGPVLLLVDIIATIARKYLPTSQPVN
jgi:hypothetical protein